MSYSYNRTASFQDRAKGNFEAIVWINAFTLEGKGLEISGTVSLHLGGPTGDAKFTNVVFQKKGRKWVLSQGSGFELVDALLDFLATEGAKLPSELDRIYGLLAK